MLTRRRAGAIVIAVTAFGTLLAGGTHAQAPRVGAPAPDIAGGPWINSTALTLEALRGRVVLVDFWTYG